MREWLGAMATGEIAHSDFMPDFTDAQDASWRLLYDGLLIKGFLPVVPSLPERLELSARRGRRG